MADYKGYKTDWNSEKRKKARFKGAQKRIKGDIRYHNSMISEEKRKQVGSYDVAPGGGTPKQDGGGRGSMNKNFYVAEDKQEANKIKKEHPGAKVRMLQKRNADGTFGHSFDMGNDTEYDKRGNTDPETYKGREDQKLKKGDVLINKEDRYVIKKDTTLRQFIEMYENIRKEYYEVKKGKKSNLEKQLQKENKAGILTQIGRGKGKFRDNESFKETYIEYKKKGKKGKINWDVVVKQKNKKEKKVDSSKLNKDLAKNNPVRFAAENKEKIDYLQAIAKEKGKTIKQAVLISEIANGDYKTWKELENLIRNNL